MPLGVVLIQVTAVLNGKRVLAPPKDIAEEFLQTRDYIMNADVRKLCGVSAATANRILAGLVKESELVKSREGGHWAYKLS